MYAPNECHECRREMAVRAKTVFGPIAQSSIRRQQPACRCQAAQQADHLILNNVGKNNQKFAFVGFLEDRNHGRQAGILAFSEGGFDKNRVVQHANMRRMNLRHLLHAQDQS